MNPEFTWFQYQSILLIVIRITAMIAAAPFLGDKRIPVIAKVGLGCFAALIMLPLIEFLPSSHKTAPGFIYAALREGMVGLSIGFLAKLLFVGVQFSGQFVSLQMGFAMAQLFNPATENNVPVLGEFYYIVAILIYLAIGGHGFLFDAIAQSFNVVPLGELAFQDEFFRVFTELTSEVFVIALKIAAPVFVSILIIDLSLGLVARLVPQMNVFIFGFPLKISVGILIIAFGLPIFGTLFIAIYESSKANIVTMIQLMAP